MAAAQADDDGALLLEFALLEIAPERIDPLRALLNSTIGFKIGSETLDGIDVLVSGHQVDRVVLVLVEVTLRPFAVRRKPVGFELDLHRDKDDGNPEVATLEVEHAWDAWFALSETVQEAGELLGILQARLLRLTWMQFVADDVVLVEKNPGKPTVEVERVEFADLLLQRRTLS